MKVLTVQQPYATLIMLGVKHWETRRWETDHRGRLLIHSGRHYNSLAFKLAQTEPFKSLLGRHGLKWHNLPFGAILGEVTLDTIETTQMLRVEEGISDIERQCGYWQNGNYAWHFFAPHAYTKPVFTAGQPGLWEIDDARLQSRRAFREPAAMAT